MGGMATTSPNPGAGVDTVEAAARLRAARAFAGLSQADIADLLGVSTVTIKRMEKGTRPCSLDELFAVADACGVPRVFMTDGFDTNYDVDVIVTAKDMRKVVIAAVKTATKEGNTELAERMARLERAQEAAHRATAAIRGGEPDAERTAS